VTDERQAVAASLDAEVEMLGLLPELLAGFETLGSSIEDALALLDGYVQLEPGTRVLDLACGKGAHSLALGARGLHVLGVDLFEPFVDQARRLAAERGLEARCRFERLDLRAAVAEASESYGVVLLVSAGRPWGTLEETIGAVRRRVKAGGCLLFEDAYLGDGGAGPTSAYGDYTDLETTRRRLRAHGDEVVGERLYSRGEIRAQSVREWEVLRQTAEGVMMAHPARRREIERFLARQRAEYAGFGESVFPAIWLLRIAA